MVASPPVLPVSTPGPGRHLALAACLLFAVALFLAVGRRSSYLDIDSGPYLSIAQHTMESGVPRSSFLFVGGGPRLPSLPNFIPPGLGFLMGIAAWPSGSAMVGAIAILLLSLVLAVLAAFLYVRRFASPSVAAVAAGLLVASPVLLPFEALVLSELPFVAAVLLALAAAAPVLEEPERPRRWLLLALAAAVVPMVRYLGIFFVPGFVAAFLAEPERRRAWRRHAKRLALFVILAWLPFTLWVLELRSLGMSPLPPRPPAQLGIGMALAGAAGYLLSWAWRYLAAAAALWVLARLTVPRVPTTRGAETREVGADAIRLPLLLMLAYLAVLIAARTKSFYYPPEEIGFRFMVPAWPLAWMAGTAAFCRWVWKARARSVSVAAALASAAVLAFGLVEAASMRLPETFPAGTATVEAAVAAVPDDSVVLANFGQSLAAHRPGVRVFGLPSKEDLRYDLDLPALVEQQQVSWVVLWALPEMERLYGAEVASWLERPPRGVAVLGRARTADGVIYQVGKAR